jgi:RimJ/RimL family protein N-acetyltransferase
MLKGKLIELDYIRSDDDLAVLARMRNENWEWFFNESKIKEGDQAKWYQAVMADDARQLYGIYESQTFIGSVGYTNLDRRNQSAEFGNLLVSPGYRGHGYAKEAAALLLDYMFLQMNVQRVHLEVFSHNEGAICLYEKLGFVREGTLRRSQFSFGKFRDVAIMGILREEWADV